MSSIDDLSGAAFDGAGAAELINIGDQDADGSIKKATPGGRGADVGIEAVGPPAVWEQAVRTLRPGGTAVPFGGTPAGAPFSVDSSAMHDQEYPLKTAVDQVDTSLLSTEQRPLVRSVDSLEDMAAGRGSTSMLVP